MVDGREDVKKKNQQKFKFPEIQKNICFGTLPIPNNFRYIFVTHSLIIKTFVTKVFSANAPQSSNCLTARSARMLCSVSGW